MRYLRAVCPFCGADTELRFPQRTHPQIKDIGAFDLHVCNGCGSLVTSPLPSFEVFEHLYQSLDHGLQAQLQQARQATPLDGWLKGMLRRAARIAGLQRDARFRFIELGAGDGRLSQHALERWPNSSGTAVDWIAPPQDNPRLEWKHADLNRDEIDTEPADLVLSVAVVEHVCSPDRLLKQALKLLKPGGTLFMLTPSYDSLASKLLGERWPFFIPGEHVNVPTLRGMRRMLERAQPHGEIFVKPWGIEYPLPYLARFAGLERVAGLLPKWDFFPWPVGVAELGVRGG